MTSSLNALSSPVQLRLRQKTFEVTCEAHHEDESTELLRVKSVSMRGAQREVTAHLVGLGYQPATLWTKETDDTGVVESRRIFRADG